MKRQQHVYSVSFYPLLPLNPQLLLPGTLYFTYPPLTSVLSSTPPTTPSHPDHPTSRLFTISQPHSMDSHRHPGLLSSPTSLSSTELLPPNFPLEPSRPEQSHFIFHLLPHQSLDSLALGVPTFSDSCSTDHRQSDPLWVPCHPTSRTVFRTRSRSSPKRSSIKPSSSPHTPPGVEVNRTSPSTSEDEFRTTLPTQGQVRPYPTYMILPHPDIQCLDLKSPLRPLPMVNKIPYTSLVTSLLVGL